MFLVKVFLLTGAIIDYAACLSTGTYYIDGTVGDNSEVPQSLAIDIIQDAFDVWTCYTGIRFRRELDPKKATIFVVFGSNQHKAYRKGGEMTQCHIYEFSDLSESGFGVAAHSTLLHDRAFPANIHLHNQQVWTYGKKSLGGRSLFEVVVHEIGHLFGISHSQVTYDPRAVMTTGHRNFVRPDQFDLTSADIGALQRTAFGKLLMKKGMLKTHCADKPWQRKMYDRLRRTKRCSDQDRSFCDMGARLGYCENEYEDARRACRSTCTFCKCEDAMRGCRVENCVKESYMKHTFSVCRKTCGLCPKFVRPWVKFENTHFARLPCVDELSSSQCAAAKQEFACSRYRLVNVMRKFCRKTCGFCR